MPTSEPAEHWRLINARALIAWAFSPDTPEHLAVNVLEFVRDRILVDPDFGQVLDANTRGEREPVTGVEIIWTFDRRRHFVEIIIPYS